MNLRDSPYWNIFRDVWDLFRISAEVQETDEFWESLVTKASTLYKQYEDKPQRKFATALILACVNEVERIYKEG